MKQILLQKRNKLYYDTWEKEKKYLTMKDCAGLFNCPLGTYYRILQREKIKEYEKKLG